MPEWVIFPKIGINLDYIKIVWILLRFIAKHLKHNDIMIDKGLWGSTYDEE